MVPGGIDVLAGEPVGHRVIVPESVRQPLVISVSESVRQPVVPEPVRQPAAVAQPVTVGQPVTVTVRQPVTVTERDPFADYECVGDRDRITALDPTSVTPPAMAAFRSSS